MLFFIFICISSNISTISSQQGLLLEKSTLTEQQLHVVELAQQGDPKSLTSIGSALLNPNSPFGENLQLALECFESAAKQKYIPAYMKLGNIYASGTGSDENDILPNPVLAFQWYSLAAEANHQGALYNCGLLLAQGVQEGDVASVVEGEYLNSDPIGALEYFKLAYDAAQTSAYASEQTTAAAATAHSILCDTIAFLPLQGISLNRVWLSGSLQVLDTAIIRLFTSASASITRFNECFLQHQGDIRSCKQDMQLAVDYLGELTEKYSRQLSHLQLYLAFDNLQDMIGPLATDRPEDNRMVELAGQYAEAFALSHYCKGKYAVVESDAACFNGAVSSAMSYYRRAGLHKDAERVFQLANAHPKAAVHWLLPSQTPRVFYPHLKAKPWWEADSFAITKELQLAFARNDGKDLQRELNDMIKLKQGTLRVATMNVQNTTSNSSSSDDVIGLQRIYTPHIGVTSSSSLYSTSTSNKIDSEVNDISEEILANESGPLWSEFGPLFDGVTWNAEKCRVLPLLCSTLQQPHIQHEMCASSYTTTSHHDSNNIAGGVINKDGDVDNTNSYSKNSTYKLTKQEVELQCGSDTIVTILKLKPGTHILPHCGTTNRRLILHFALRGANKVWFRAGGGDSEHFGVDSTHIGSKSTHIGSDFTDNWVDSYGGGDGHAIVFDDSFEHEVKHRGEQDRYVVLVVLKHPDLVVR